MAFAPIARFSITQPRCVEEPAPAEPKLTACVGFHVAGKFREVADRKILANNQHQRLLGQQCDRREVGDRVEERLLVEGLVVDEVSAAAEKDLIAVGRCVRDAARAGHAARARNVLDHDLAADDFAHLLREQASNHVGRPAGCIRHDHGDRPRRPILSARGAAGDEGGCQNDLHPTEFHWNFPCIERTRIIIVALPRAWT